MGALLEGRRRIVLARGAGVNAGNSADARVTLGWPAASANWRPAGHRPPQALQHPAGRRETKGDHPEGSRQANDLTRAGRR
jgi:hypothetical protein